MSLCFPNFGLTDALPVTLSLSADQSLAADIVFPERRIILNRDKHSVTVGRASKVSSKGFIAAIENAWFESAVMSRLHAQIIADMDKKVCRHESELPVPC